MVEPEHLEPALRSCLLTTVVESRREQAFGRLQETS